MLSLRLGFLFWILSAVPWEGKSNSSSFELSASPPAPRRGKISILEGPDCLGEGGHCERYCCPWGILPARLGTQL